MLFSFSFTLGFRREENRDTTLIKIFANHDQKQKKIHRDVCGYLIRRRENVFLYIFYILQNYSNRSVFSL